MRRHAGTAPKSRRSARSPSLPVLAGWLFADLFLVLFIVAFSSQPTVAIPKPKLVVSSASHKPLKPKRHGPQGLQSAPVDFKLFVSPTELDSADPTVQAQARAQLLAGVHQELAQRRLLGRKAGFVLVFATSVSGAPDPINEALKVAASVIASLKHYDSAVFPGGTGGEGLWAGSGDYFHFQIFFYTQ